MDDRHRYNLAWLGLYYLQAEGGVPMLVLVVEREEFFYAVFFDWLELGYGHSVGD